jgi:hypothetical protein
MAERARFWRELIEAQAVSGLWVTSRRHLDQPSSWSEPMAFGSACSTEPDERRSAMCSRRSTETAHDLIAADGEALSGD